MCWQNCPSNKGLIDCGSYCAPQAAGLCANFIGATYQNCKNKYPQRRMVLDMVLSGNYTQAQIQAAAAGDTTIFKGSAWDPKSVEIIHYTSHTGRDAASHAGLLHPETTRIPKTAGKVHLEYTDLQHEGWEEVEVNDDPNHEGMSTPDSWQHVRIMHEPKEDDVIEGLWEDEGSGVRVVRLLQAAADSACKKTDTTPECWCVGKAYGIYPDPAGNANRYLICGGNVGLLKSCPTDTVFNPERHLCVAPSDSDAPPSPPPGGANQKPPVPPKDCTGRDDGIYFQDSRDNSTAYKCDSGQLILDFCPDDYVLDETTGECKIPDYTPPGAQAPCRDPDCFCSDKKNGNYTDVIRGNTKRYISCRGGKGRWRKCAKDHIFNVVTLTCGFLPPNATTPIKGCKTEDCYCVGRADGVYVNPWSNSTGISCSFQTHALIECSEGYEFVITKQPFCQPIDPENPFGLPPMPPGAKTTPMAPPDVPKHRRNRRRGG
ncbi:hypothetical protein HXX76_004494 [Chlamydomonas incerta]|nr:hypothetical protein HXX76_004494 [Chlamydomonas incerta]|eukprot:KAG2439126.1 hypothetical protein HXX76_004494 [Chlamydomonas incerta]